MLRSLCLAAAQSVSIPGDVAANVAQHVRLSAAAAAAGANLVLFPELSLSGYEPERVAACALSPDDAVLQPLQAAANASGLTVVVGAPLVSGQAKPFIGAVVFAPQRRPSTYCKRYLHPGEERFAVAGTADSFVFDLGADRIGLAICADTANPRHPRDAVAAGANLYLAGVLWSRKGYAHDAAQIAGYAADGIGVLLANHGGPSGGYETGGQSAFWAPDGRQIVVAPAAGEALVLASRTDGVWSGRTLSA